MFFHKSTVLLLATLQADRHAEARTKHRLGGARVVVQLEVGAEAIAAAEMRQHRLDLDKRKLLSLTEYAWLQGYVGLYVTYRCSCEGRH